MYTICSIMSSPTWNLYHVLTSFWLLRVKWFDEMIDVYVSTASSKEIPCKGESLGNHLEGLETQIKDILMIAPAK